MPKGEEKRQPSVWVVERNSVVGWLPLLSETTWAMARRRYCLRDLMLKNYRVRRYTRDERGK